MRNGKKIKIKLNKKGIIRRSCRISKASTKEYNIKDIKNIKDGGIMVEVNGSPLSIVIWPKRILVLIRLIEYSTRCPVRLSSSNPP